MNNSGTAWVDYGLENFLVQKDYLEELEEQRQKLHIDYWQAKILYEKHKSDPRVNGQLGRKVYDLSIAIEEISLQIEEYLFYKYS